MADSLRPTNQNHSTLTIIPLKELACQKKPLGEAHISRRMFIALLRQGYEGHTSLNPSLKKMAQPYEALPARVYTSTIERSMVRPAGVEPATYGSEVRRSIQLSYRRIISQNTFYSNNRK